MINKKYNFYKTQDGSIGLFDNDAGDILHSKSGALKEAFEKFINPINLNKYIKNKEKLNVLDICYGTGYNSKALLTSINNISINIDALEYDKELIFLSPFLSDGIDDNLLKIILIKNIISDGKLIAEFNNFINNFYENIDLIFTTHQSLIMARKIIDAYISTPSDDKQAFLHNIYYNYISDDMKNVSKFNKYSDIIINYYLDDARKTILSLKKDYDIVFLDAYSPQLDPILWTYDFLYHVKTKMNYNSILLSYSKSTPFRSALVKLGFNVGKTLIDNLDMGTVASLNKNNIINPLDNYDMELISTRSGITYKDPKLSYSKEEIKSLRNIEMANSNLMSHTAFLRSFKK